MKKSELDKRLQAIVDKLAYNGCDPRVTAGAAGMAGVVMELLEGSDMGDDEIADRIAKRCLTVGKFGESLLGRAEKAEGPKRPKKAKALMRRVERIQGELAGAERALVEELPDKCKVEVLKVCAHVDVALATVRAIEAGRFDDVDDAQVAKEVVSSAMTLGAIRGISDAFERMMED